MSNTIYSQKYYNLYHKIINKYKHLNLKKSSDLYIEKHHIVPRCLGGRNNKDNLVSIPAREHFLLHWMLCRIYKDNYKLYYAFNSMCMMNSEKERYTSKSFKYARELFSKISKGRKLSEQQKRHISSVHKGKKLSDEHKKKISKTTKGRKRNQHSEETKLKISISHIGKKFPNGYKKKTFIVK